MKHISDNKAIMHHLYDIVQEETDWKLNLFYMIGNSIGYDITPAGGDFYTGSLYIKHGKIMFVRFRPQSEYVGTFLLSSPTCFDDFRALIKTRRHL